MALLKSDAAKLVIDVGDAAKKLVDVIYNAKPGAAITAPGKGCWWKNPEALISVNSVELDRHLTDLEMKIKLARKWLK